MRPRDIVRREGKWEALTIVESGGCGDERSGEQWWPGAQVVIAKRWNSIHDACRDTRKLGIEEPIASPNTALSSRSKNLFQESALGPRSIGETNSGRKVQMASGCECLRNSRIACDQQPRRRTRKQCRLFSRNVRLQLVVLLPERRDHVPAQTSVDRKVVAC